MRYDIQKLIEGAELKWDIILQERLKDKLFLEQHGYKVYSQNYEDGVIQEIFKRIGTTNKKFIEFGVQDGIESNTHYLLLLGWSGLWIEGSEEHCNTIKRKFKETVISGQLKLCNAFITKSNINLLFSQSGYRGEIDLLSIDIDGNDYHVLEAITEVNPRVISIEFNSLFPPECHWVMPYNENHVVTDNSYFGASLLALEQLCARKGYQLVGTNITAVNAFFVRKDLTADLFPLPATAENLYNPLRARQITKLRTPTHIFLNESLKSRLQFNQFEANKCKELELKKVSKIKLLLGLPRAVGVAIIQFVKKYNHKFMDL